MIEQKDFPGYFLIVHDIVRYARSRGILCQGRGSAANSAVCYLLDITAVDSIFYELPFERFLSSMRDEEPDIDVDFDSDRREEVIQYVYEKYGRQNAAQVANVISYRPKIAVRDMAKALGHCPGQQDAWSQQVERWGALVESDDHDIPEPVIELAQQVLKFPRHLGIHSGGMVLTDRPVGEVVPIEHARMDDRTVLQWDKDDCAWMGLVKFDLLGLGMLAALQYCFDLVRDTLGEQWTLDTIPKEEEGVYDMLCRADSIGVFQVESRAQMGLLPRLQPRRFYDLVVEIALIRPGPIQGGAVHPYVRRRLGQEPITYLHPKLVEPLERTLGGTDVPGAADADRDGGRRLHRRGRRPAAPRDGVEARGREDRVAAREAVRRDGQQRHHRRGRRRHLQQDPGVRELRLRREPLAELRAARLRELVDASCTTRRRSSPRCCARSRWGSTPPRRWWRMPGGTASRCAGPIWRSRGVGRTGAGSGGSGCSGRGIRKRRAASPRAAAGPAVRPAPAARLRRAPARRHPSPCGSGSPR